jgi:hypothetical protein
MVLPGSNTAGRDWFEINRPVGQPWYMRPSSDCWDKGTFQSYSDRINKVYSTYLMPISRCISVSDSALIIAPDFTLARHAATYQAGMPTQSSNQATIVGPFQRANGVPAFIASARSSCLYVTLKGKGNIISSKSHELLSGHFFKRLPIFRCNVTAGFQRHECKSVEPYK